MRTIGNGILKVSFLTHMHISNMMGLIKLKTGNGG